MIKNLPASAGNTRDVRSNLGLGRLPGVGNSDSLQYSCLENSLDRGAWWVTVHGVSKSRTQVSNFILVLSVFRRLGNLPCIKTRILTMVSHNVV